jgi:hypothetical protein
VSAVWTDVDALPIRPFVAIGHLGSHQRPLQRSCVLFAVVIGRSLSLRAQFSQRSLFWSVTYSFTDKSGQNLCSKCVEDGMRARQRRFAASECAQSFGQLFLTSADGSKWLILALTDNVVLKRWKSAYAQLCATIWNQGQYFLGIRGGRYFF